MKEPEFFTEEDLLTVKEWDDEVYDSNSSEHQNARVFLTEVPETKTKFWAQKVAEKLGMVDKTRRDPRKRAGKKSKFKGYTWGRIYKKGQPTEEVFYTIGINGDKEKEESPFLHIKIDRQFQRSSKLTDQQQQKARQLLVNENEEYRYEEKIYLNELGELSWDKLIQTTINFIEDHEKTYDNIVDEVAEYQKRYFTRICYNSDGWRRPSGPEGKSTSKESFEGITGFGMEEWLFAEELNTDGYQYGFLQGVNQNHPDSEVIDVDLYTVEDTDQGKITFWVCSIKNIEVIDVEEAHHVQKETGLEDRVIRYLKTVPSSEKIDQDITSFVGDTHLNIRFKLRNVDYPDTKDLQVIDLDLNKYKRYLLFKGSLFDQLSSDAKQKSTGFDTLSNTSGNRSENSTSYGKRSPGSYEIKHVHDQISKGVEAYLKGLMKTEESVNYEVLLGSYKKVDVVFEKANEIIYYEIKTHPKLIFCIREGIGQLLEYGYYNRPNHEKKLNMILVSPHSPTDDLSKYMEKLRSMSEFNIYYQQYDLKTESLKLHV
ncbi:MAG: hypothetical protein WDZ80_00595 [Candidatus Paceibacterota bacterium]